MNSISWPTLLAAFVVLRATPAAHAEHRDFHDEVEELIVSAPMGKQESDSSMPVDLLSGEALRENAAATLGETLKKLPGVTTTSFGPGVGSPVIRGQSGNRVGVLQDGLGTLDASTVSQDHANSVEPLLAERIEVIRGPSTLLYGNGAIGGIVNIIDNRIPDRVPERFEAAAELRYDSASNGSSGVFKLEGGDPLAWHLDGLYREHDDVEIPGPAINGTPGVEAAGSQGFIDNSDASSQSMTAGASFVGERGFIGASLSGLDYNYGIAPGPREPGEETADVRIDMAQTRFNIKGELDMDGFFESLHADAAFNDYRHKELEIAGGATETGTVFNNEGREARLQLNHRAIGNIKGTLGTQLIERAFSALGEESFIPTSDIDSQGLFAVESIDTGDWLYEFGVRFDNQSIVPSGGCSSDETTWSGSASAIWRFRADTNLLLSLNRSERAATVEERYSNIHLDTCSAPAEPAELVAHEPTARFEIGNPGLGTESSRNLEIALRKHAGAVEGEFNLFYNRIKDYIYLADSGVMFEGTGISHYRQQDARFTGLEAEITFPLGPADGTHADLSLFGDYVRAELDDGTNVPRIPPLRLGAELAWLQESWSLKLRATAVAKQDHVAPSETPTARYNLVDVYFDYHLVSGERELVFFAKGNNLLDEEIRNHTSLVKDFAPEPGIGFEAGIRYGF